MLRMTLKKAVRVYTQALVSKYRHRNGLEGRKLSVSQLEEALESVAEATKATPRAVRSWFSGHSNPTGEAEIRMICHLERRGFQIIELEGLDADVREILWAISLNMVQLDWAMKKLGFSQRSEFLKVLRGSSLPNPEQVRKISRLIDLMERVEIKHLQTLEEQLEKEGLLDDDKAIERKMRRLRKKKLAKETE